MNLFGHIDKSVDAPTITRQTHEVRLESDDVVNDIHAQRLRALGDVEIDALTGEVDLAATGQRLLAEVAVAQLEAKSESDS